MNVCLGFFGTEFYSLLFQHFSEIFADSIVFSSVVAQL